MASHCLSPDNFSSCTAYHKHTEIETWRFERDVEQRVALLKKNIRCYSNATVSPLLYRSHLFTPISQDTPSVLLDFIDPSSDSSNRLSEFVQKRVHLTLYHLTHRYDVDSKWMERMSSLIPQRESHSVDNSTEKPMDDESDRIPSMTRVSYLFSFVDSCFRISGFIHLYFF